MRAVFWKELRELRLALLVGLALATALGVGMGLKTHNNIAVVLFAAMGFEGCVVGAWQAFHDRSAARDEFVIHRPVSTIRIQVARGAAGVATVALITGATFAEMLYVGHETGLDRWGNPLPGWNERPWWNDLTVPRAAFAVLLALAAWAIARLGASWGRPAAAFVLAPSLVLVCVLMAGRMPGLLSPSLIVIAAGAIALVLGVVNAAAHGPTRRP